MVRTDCLELDILELVYFAKHEGEETPTQKCIRTHQSSTYKADYDSHNPPVDLYCMRSTSVV